MKPQGEQSDEQLLLSAGRDEESLGAFYVRYEHRVIAFFMRAVGRGDLAADLTAETFASLVESAERYDPALGKADGWLFGIARNVLARSRERGRVEDRARRSIGLGVLALDDEAIERIEATAGSADAVLALGSLPEDQRDAVIERVVNERGYEEIASELECSPSVVRKRVSRGLAAMRNRIKEMP
jgi:RNA polymerase sigma-70 factor (ECF subfamily)